MRARCRRDRNVGPTPDTGYRFVAKAPADYDGLRPVVIHTAVLAYLPTERRDAFAATMAAHPEVVWLANEGDGIVRHDDGTLDMDAAASLITARTRVVAFTHVSNALGTVNPVAMLTAEARAAGARVLVDGAHAPGQVPLGLARLPEREFAGAGDEGIHQRIERIRARNQRLGEFHRRQRACPYQARRLREGAGQGLGHVSIHALIHVLTPA